MRNADETEDIDQEISVAERQARDAEYAKKYVKLLGVLARLNTKEFAEYFEDMAPKCQRWRAIKEAGFKFSEVGSYVSAFITEKMSQ